MPKKMVVFLCTCLLATMIAGCQPARKPLPPQTGPETSYNTKLSQLSPSERRIITGRLSNVASSVDGVSRAIVVLSSDNYNNLVALVGLNVTNEAKKSQIKKTVAQKVKNSDKRVSQVLVTTDPNMIKKISDIAAGIIEGKPVKSYARDVNELTRELQK